MTKEKVIYTVVLFVVCIFCAIQLNSKLMESPDNARYTKAMEFYRGEDFQNAYYQFSRVSCFSSIKPASIFRQARCATILGDNKTAIRNYYILLKRFPNSPLYAVSEYNLAVILFENQKYNQALKHFKHISRRFKNSEFAIASKYYIGRINQDPNLIIDYIELSPSGRFAQQAIDTIEKYNLALKNKQNLIIANSYLDREKYNEASNYFAKTSLSKSWTGYAKSEFKRGNNDFAKNIVIKGLKSYSNNVDIKQIYDVIDLFVNLSDNKLATIRFLLSVNRSAQGCDYLLYLLAKNSSKYESYQIYKKVFIDYPDSQFAADSLSKVFYGAVQAKNKHDVINMGKYHLAHYKNTNSAPAVMYWLGKTYEQNREYDMANSYYKGVLHEYPDSYYALKSHARLNDNMVFTTNEIKPKPIVFPVKNHSETNFAVRLAQLGDYDFVKELYKDDKFVQSWVEYKQGHYTNSALIARDAMDALDKKPNFKDTRWRLVYPLHYYQYVQKYSNRVNPIIIQSIIKEESHFNPSVTSSVGAVGLMQLMPVTANEIALGYGMSSNLYNPENNIHLGCLYYAKIKRALNNKDTFAILAYNGGIGSVMNWMNKIKSNDLDDFIEKIPYPETQDYVKKVLKSYWNYSNIYQY